MALDTVGTASERRLAIVDKNRDLYLTQVRVYGAQRKTVKLGQSYYYNKSLPNYICVHFKLKIGCYAIEILEKFDFLKCLYWLFRF